MQLQANSITTCFETLPDFRVERTKKHKLGDVLFIALSAMLCGFDGWEEIELFAKAKVSWLRKYLELPHGIPSHDTIRRIFMLLDPEAFRQCFSDWVKQLPFETTTNHIAIDGKTLRGSRCQAKDKPAIHMLSAWLTDNELVLGQFKIFDKSNEITAIPALLDTLLLEGNVVSLDAMGCQRAIAEQLIEKKADYVFGLKGNQGNLHDEVKVFFDYAVEKGFIHTPHTSHEDLDSGHGRIEQRACYAVSTDYIEQACHWTGAKSVVMVHSQRWIGSAYQTEYRYYLSSLVPEAKTLSKIIRNHWSIENNLHWCLDVGFGEDKSRIHAEYAGENLSVIRHMAMNLVKANRQQKGGIARKRKLAALDDRYLEQILFNRSN